MVDLDGVTRLRFDYDGEDDIALFHVGGPRPAVTEDVGDGWYLRLVDDEIAGLELHGLRRRLLTTPFYARLFRPAIRELEQLSGQTIEADRLVVDAAPEAVPMTTRLLLLLVGQALTRLETIQRAEYEAAAGRLRSAN
jgi:hypothetical protein